MSEGPTIRPAFLRRSYLSTDDDSNKRQAPGGVDLIVVVFNNLPYSPTLQWGTRAPVHLWYSICQCGWQWERLVDGWLSWLIVLSCRIGLCPGREIQFKYSIHAQVTIKSGLSPLIYSYANRRFLPGIAIAIDACWLLSWDGLLSLDPAKPREICQCKKSQENDHSNHSNRILDEVGLFNSWSCVQLG